MIINLDGNVLSLSNFSSDKPNLLFTQVGFIFSVKLSDRPPPLNQSTRTEIYNFIKDNPGIQFRGLCNGLNLSIGVAQYHLGILTKAGLLSIFKEGRYKRFFKSNKFTGREMMVISLLRHLTVRKIFSMLLNGQPLWHRELASRLSLSSQALTWQINHLEEKGLIHRQKVGMRTYYFLEEENSQILRKYIDNLEYSC